MLGGGGGGGVGEMVAQVDCDSVSRFQGGEGRTIGKDCPGLGALVTPSLLPALSL